MKPLQRFVATVLLVLGAVLASSTARAQTASLTTPSPYYGTAGGNATFTATFVYPTPTSVPSAIALSVQLPAGWQFVSHSLPAGASAAAAPTAGDNLCEWAFSSFPTGGQLQFAFTVSYPAGLTGSQVVSVPIASYRSPLTNMTVSNITFAQSVPPAFTTQPANVTVELGQSASFTVVVTGTPTPTLQWRKNSTAIAGATNATFTIASVQASDAGSYDVVATGALSSTTSTAATLTILNVPPAITTQPVGITALVGQARTLTVVATGTPAPTYQWRKNGNAITGATASTLTFPSLVVGDSGNYDVVVTNSAGTVTSNVATLTVNAPPAIATQPASATVLVGQAATFTVVATGTPTPTYQWRKNTANLAGATNASLAFATAQLSDAGSYDVVVTNAAGTVTSAAATLTVNAPPAITTQPSSAVVTAGQSATLSVVATGSPAPTYQWRKNSTNLTGATNASLAFAAVSANDAGSYDVVVSNIAGTVTSNVATLTVNVPPAIVTQPVSAGIGIGTSRVLSVSATGTAPLSYQWSKNGTAIGGATLASLSLVDNAGSAGGTYRVTVSNIVGSIQSDPAVITVVDARPTHTVSGPGYIAGGTVTITNTITFSNDTAGLGWQMLLPTGWSYASGGGNEGDVKPVAGTTSLLEWAWTTIPTSPLTFTVTLNVPATTTGDQQIASLAIVRQFGVAAQIIALADPLVVSKITTHSADIDRNFRFSLLELTRVIELYNTRNGTLRTGCYKVDATGEDGFSAEPTRANTAVVTLTNYHSADSNRDGKLSLLELTRVIELYNYRSGTTRTGQYHAQAGTEDGFNPGP